MAGFAVFAKNYTTYKKNGAQYQQRVSYIKSLYEVHTHYMASLIIKNEYLS
jgi:hypothetical protein